jgi:hypothetical protein
MLQLLLSANTQKSTKTTCYSLFRANPPLVNLGTHRDADSAANATPMCRDSTAPVPLLDAHRDADYDRIVQRTFCGEGRSNDLCGGGCFTDASAQVVEQRLDLRPEDRLRGEAHPEA